MIQLTRLNNIPFHLNCDLIETIEEMPDTIITMTTGKKLVVEEPAAVILEKILQYRNLCFRELRLKVIHEDAAGRPENVEMAGRQE